MLVLGPSPKLSRAASFNVWMTEALLRLVRRVGGSSGHGDSIVELRIRAEDPRGRVADAPLQEADATTHMGTVGADRVGLPQLWPEGLGGPLSIEAKAGHHRSHALAVPSVAFEDGEEIATPQLGCRECPVELFVGRSRETTTERFRRMETNGSDLHATPITGGTTSQSCEHCREHGGSPRDEALRQLP